MAKAGLWAFHRYTRNSSLPYSTQVSPYRLHARRRCANSPPPRWSLRKTMGRKQADKTA